MDWKRVKAYKSTKMVIASMAFSNKERRMALLSKQIKMEKSLKKEPINSEDSNKMMNDE